MLTVETIRKVRVAHGRHEKSIKEIARDLVRRSHRQGVENERVSR